MVEGKEVKRYKNIDLPDIDAARILFSLSDWNSTTTNPMKNTG